MNKRKMPTTVPVQAGGYFLQETRFLYHLLAAKRGTYVSLEYISDVATHTADGLVLAEEDKSSIEGNPVTDRSVALWKTLSNWVNAVQDGILVPDKTTFRLYVPKNCYGNIVEKFSKSDTIENANSALEEAKNELWGSPPKYPKRDDVAQTLRPYVENVFNAPEEIICKIIKGFVFEKGSGSSYADIDEAIADKAIPKEIIDDVRKHLLGWVKEKIDHSIEQGKPPYISYDSFIDEMTFYNRKANRQNLLISFAAKPSDQEKNEELKKPRTYLRQLEFVEVDFEDKLKAISDYLMASVDRSQWALRGIVHENSFDDLEENLIRTWRNEEQTIKITEAEKTDIAKGKLLYFKCSQHRTNLEGKPVPEHFVPGSFQALSDDEKLGWHPDWKNLLSSLESSRN